MTEYLLLLGFCAGAGLAGGASAAFILGVLRGLRFPAFPSRKFLQVREKRELPSSGGSNRAFIAGSAVGGFLGAVFGFGTPLFFNAVGIGSSGGALLGWFVYRNIQETRRLRLLREIAVLYEAVDFFTQAGYTIPQALRLGSVAAPSLRPCVERCLARYPSDRARALEEFAREVGLSEAALLSSILAHAEESGMALGRSALQEESRSLEELRRNLAELKVVSKPLYFAVYRGLPLIAVGGVMVGPLAYKLIKLLQTVSNLS
ncbi:hypothetical protein SAMN02745218_01185 [Desulfofundulus australicus DSM 11792]|uniref:Type II secretion system (T2SS), protein F n=1 Tax=Desulfofundulus australicus DSM 11792 TaxID=1121425 RepID=A0A1M4XV52_9FIRM|nr:hypothetical protein [Desulfofundulus australicus]SHE97457.1 hypothetical protein SAMN02745218_01185 [Desulfofundulus australicus DSM 11792]